MINIGIDFSISILKLEFSSIVLAIGTNTAILFNERMIGESIKIRIEQALKFQFYKGDNMNINPDKVKELVLLFSELDDGYQKELMIRAYELLLKQSQKNLINKEGKIFKNEEDYKKEIEKRSSKRARETIELLQILDQVGDEEKAQLVIVLDKLSHGDLTKETEIEIKINSKKVSIKDYIEEILPLADFKSANEKATEYLKEIDRI